MSKNIKYPYVDYDDVARILYITFREHGNTLGVDLDDEQNVIVFEEDGTSAVVGMMITNATLIKQISLALKNVK